MANGLLFVYAEPGPVPEAEFNDWYDNEHVPARLGVPGFSNVCRFHADDGQLPSWLATYEIAAGVLDGAAYKALAMSASAREKSIMSSVSTLDRRVYEPLTDSAPDAGAAPPAVLAVSLDVPAALEADLAAWYADEHTAMLLAVPGWRRVRRYRLTEGNAPRFLALHEIAGTEVFSEPAYQAAVSTPWRTRIMESATRQERRVFGLYKAFG